MTRDPSPITAAAEALKADHAALLAGEPSFREPEVDRRMDAIDAARIRLQGGERPGRDQLSLDVP